MNTLCKASNGNLYMGPNVTPKCGTTVHAIANEGLVHAAFEIHVQANKGNHWPSLHDKCQASVEIKQKKHGASLVINE